jgi:N-carbamoyl-L-amino-acid hydrolase
MPAINAGRLLSDLRTLRTFGAVPDHPRGIIRPSFSPADMEAREWLRGKFEEAGLEASIDKHGIVFGRSKNPGPALLLGSHSDSQPRGGWLDGNLGVIYALEAARALAEDPATAGLAVDIASWTDEEGSYLGYFGSRSFLNYDLADQIEAATGHPRVTPGNSLPEAIAAAGLENHPRTVAEKGRYLGFFEAHIEQGPHLEQFGLNIGVVTDIVGSRGYTILFKGEQNHAGTTPMALRRDAGMASLVFGARLDEEFRAIAGKRSVWTFGESKFEPGSRSIIPGSAELWLQFRDVELSNLEAFDATTRRVAAEVAAERGVEIEVGPGGTGVPKPMDPWLQEQVRDTASYRLLSVASDLHIAVMSKSK